MAVLSGGKRKQSSKSIAPQIRGRLDTFAHGDSDYDSLLAEIKELCKLNEDAVWETLSVLDQYHRRGVLPDELFRSLKATVSYIALGPPLAAARDAASNANKQKPELKQPAAPAATAAAPAPPPVAPSVQAPSVQESPEALAEPAAEEPITIPSRRGATAQSTHEATSVAESEASAFSEITAEEFLKRMGGTTLFNLAHDETDSAVETQHSNARINERPSPQRTSDVSTPDREVTRVRDIPPTPSTAQRNTSTEAKRTERESNARQAAIAKSVIPGRVLHDRYAIESALAFGRSTAVFRVRDQFRTREAERPIAVKMLLLAAVPQAPQQFEHELAIAQQLAHPNIVKVFDLDRDGDLLFYSMELIEGQTLNELLQFSPPKRPQAMAILTQVANALTYMHDRNIAHGDVHPDNIMVSATGQVKLLDFGAANEQHSSTSSSGPRHAADASDKPSSSLLYASCERLEGMPADRRDDIFSLSCIAYELLGREHPFRGRLATRARDANQFAPRLPELNTRQWRCLQHGLAWQRDERPVSVRDWLAALVESNTAPAPEVPIAAEPRSALESVDDQITAAPITHDTRRREPPMSSHMSAHTSPRISAHSRVPYRTPSRRRISTTWYVTIVVGVVAVLAFAFMRFDFDRATTPALAQAQSSVKQAINSLVAESNQPSTNAQSSSAGSPLVTSDTIPNSTPGPTPNPTPSSTNGPKDFTVNNAPPKSVEVEQSSSATVATSSDSNSHGAASSESFASTQSTAPTSTHVAPAVTPTAPVEVKRPVAPPPTSVESKPDKLNESHGRIGFAQDTFVVKKGDGAARIKLKRDGGASGKVTFTWWAEPGTAEAGKDFMSLGKKTEVLDNGEREITVFVPLITGSDYADRHVFFVELSDPSNGLGIGKITRARVVIADE